MVTAESPDEKATSSAVHERRRAEIVGSVPASYNPALHLAIPSALGLSALVGAACLIRGLSWLELLAVPLTYVLALGFEWRAHKYVLHKKTWPLTILYVRHELQHHVIYTNADMAMRSAREMRLILMPAYAVVVSFAAVVPLALPAWLLLSRNVALLVVMTSMVFFLSYEWLHLSYHLPPESRIARLWMVARLRELHRRHHDPRLMKSWNFNVTIPLFDVIHGTLWSPEREEARRKKRALTAAVRGHRPIEHSS